ncbi:MAG TPA: hypothetical protein VNW29_05055 [Candidatus Sulfotelmatobacter sp.]|jgi:hypothetical protein|nr:hypothetical protein [Candidatus Sulfotelmatobacter sp.]
MNEGINLLEPNKKTTQTAFFRRLHTMRVITVGILFIVSVSSVIIFILVALSPLPALQKQEQSLSLNLSQFQKDIVKLALLNERTSSIKNIVSKRQTLDQPLGLIQAKMTSGTTITAMQTDKKSIILTVNNSSLKSLDDFLNGIIQYVQEKTVFSNVTLISLTNDANTNINTYILTVQLTLL